MLTTCAVVACQDLYPAVAIKNGYDKNSGIFIANIRWNGCSWPEVVPPQNTTAFHVCLPGQGRVYFDLYDTNNPQAGWQKRQTTVIFDLGNMTSCTIVISQDNHERDVSAPGPYGH